MVAILGWRMSKPQTRWTAVFVLILAGVVAALQIGKAAIALPVLQHDLALTLTVASWIVGAYGVLGAVAGLPAGITASVFAARRTLLAGLVVTGLGSLAGALVTSGWLMIATRVIEGCGFLACVLAIPRLLRIVTAPRDLDTVLAVWGAYMPIGSVIMMLAGPSIMTFGWQALWVINGAIALIAAVAVSRMAIEEPPPGSAAVDGVVSNVRIVLAAPGPLLLALAFGIYTFQYMAMAGLLPTLLVDRLGLSISAAGLVSALTIGANAVGNMSADALLRLGVPTWVIAATAFTFVGLAGFGIFSDALPVAIVVALASLSLGLTGLIPGSVYAAAPKLAPTSAVLAIVLGLINQATNLGNLFGPAAMALVVENFGWARAPWLFVAVAIVGMSVALGLRIALRRPVAGP
jgi:predicted MFS family arabinose efflux permease